jgi:hypothetical protein
MRGGGKADKHISRKSGKNSRFAPYSRTTAQNGTHLKPRRMNSNRWDTVGSTRKNVEEKAKNISKKATKVHQLDETRREQLKTTMNQVRGIKTDIRTARGL